MVRFQEGRSTDTGEKYLTVFGSGTEIRDDPILNKGTCFSESERDELGLRGALPPDVATPEEQEARAYGHYQRATDDIQRYLVLAALQDRNETLFYRLLLHHLEEMIPIVYTPTVGKVCQQYSHIYRRPRGLYISSRDRGRIAEVVASHRREGCRIIVLTDNEAILGIGDQGVGGMGITIGKLALYTAGAGIHPAHGLPIDFDIGTNNRELLDDPLYLGVREPRLQGDEYLTLLDELVAAIQHVYPDVLLQWEDFAKHNAFRVLERYRTRLLSFNDDIQGTGAVAVAGLQRALRDIGRSWEDERIVIYGAGAAGGGTALATRAALRAAGLSETRLAGRVLSLDSNGLILSDRAGLPAEKRAIAADPAVAVGWSSNSRPPGLAEVIHHFRPTVLIGVSGQPGSFTEPVVRRMHAGCARPIILALSNPNSLCEAAPEDLLRWTDGAAVVGTGSPFPDVRWNGTTHRVGQGNNALIFPGIGLGATTVRARWLPDEAFSAAARAVANFPGETGPGAPIFPPLSRLREVAVEVARAVGRTLIDVGAAPAIPAEELDERLAAAIWNPVYLPYRRASRARPAAARLDPVAIR